MSAEPCTRIVKAGSEAATAAAQCLAAGGLVAFPTETVYGLGADATNGSAVARLYAAKGRPSFNPLIAHVADLAAARRLARFDPTAMRLAQAFWPGPLTLVLPRMPDCPVSDLATAGLDSIAVRVPDHPVARELIATFGKPIVAPSANRSGHVSPTTAAHVLADLRGRIDLVIDGGRTSVGVESTIVACLDKPTLLRPGGLAREAITALLGHPLAEAPWCKRWRRTKRRWRPACWLRITRHRRGCGSKPLRLRRMKRCWLSARRVEHSAAMLNLSVRGDLVEAAANLFSHLRALDASGAKAIAVMPVPEQGLGEAINDRLRRAAAPRGH